MLEEVAIEKEKEWNMVGEDRLSWAETTSKQIRSMLRDISQSLNKWRSKQSGKKQGPPAKWLLPFVDKDGDDKDEDEITETTADKLYKYDDKKKKAYQYTPGKEHDEESWVYCDTIAKGGQSDEVVATWADGATWSVPGLSFENYEASKQGNI